MENKPGNPYHAKDGKFTSKGGQGQGTSSAEPKHHAMPELQKIHGMLDNLIERAHEIVAKRKAAEEKQEKPKPKLFSDSRYYKNFLTGIEANRRANRVYHNFASEEQMADELADRLAMVYDEDRDTIKQAIVTRLNQLDKEEKETERWKKAGYKERMFDMPSEVETDDGHTIEVGPEDYAGFLKMLQIELTPEQLYDLKDNQVLPYDVFDEDMLSDFIEYIKDKKGDEED